MEQLDGKASGETTDQAIARVASGSHGVVARADLARIGVTPEQIRNRLRKGSLIGIHRGVYRVGHQAPNRESTYMAAVKACGDRAVLCGRAAAHLWGLVKGVPPRPEVRATGKRLVPGVVTHRAIGFVPTEVTDWRGIPV
ncbi:MAG: type IV toxin-antitoxin system AbiEi family antitoxin domain-containing protein, partial [Solirubrobacterales bacterium]